jgi:GNAT superfamily N-acetyltransferase
MKTYTSPSNGAAAQLHTGRQHASSGAVPATQPRGAPGGSVIDQSAVSLALHREQHLMNMSPQALQLKGRAQLMAAASAAALVGKGLPGQRQRQDRLQDTKELHRGGLPGQLKSGIESLSGLSMGHVKVHYNSDKPAQLHAHAYAQGDEIHVGPGQEHHLPHEAWHVVQQAQGRVKPTLQMKDGLPVNDDVGLEAEADLMGTEAVRAGADRLLQKAADTSAPACAAAQLQTVADKTGLGRALSTVQLRPRTAVVKWNVTHEVIPTEPDSLFGSDPNPLLNEGVELHKGERIEIDDEKIFHSRRGANQERAERRSADAAGHLKHKWLALERVEGREVSGAGYVRAQTLDIVDDGEREEILVDRDPSDVESAQEAADNIHASWQAAKAKRRLSAVAWERWEAERGDKDSSPSWDQIEEGHDVSKELSSAPEEPGAYIAIEGSSDQAIFRAMQLGAPIGIIVIEKRGGDKYPDDGGDANARWYLRWLVGHATASGAGGSLLTRALQHARDQGATAVWVQSAPSAVEWYGKKGFVAVSAEAQEAFLTVEEDEVASESDEDQPAPQSGDSEEPTTPNYKEGWDSALMVLRRFP